METETKTETKSPTGIHRTVAGLRETIEELKQELADQRAMVRESIDPRYRWKQFLVIRDRSVVIVEMTPALHGWNFGRITRQGDADWTMPAADIVAWKLANDDRAVVVSDSDLAAQVIARAEMS